MELLWRWQMFPDIHPLMTFKVVKVKDVFFGVRRVTAKLVLTEENFIQYMIPALTFDCFGLR